MMQPPPPFGQRAPRGRSLWTRAAAITTAFLLIAGNLGCFTVRTQAPYGLDVKVLPPNVPVEVTRKYQKWYAVWGIVPISETSDPRDIILREKLVEVRVATENALEDTVSNAFFFLLFELGFIIPQTIRVEGNRAPLAQESAAEKPRPVREPKSSSGS